MHSSFLLQLNETYMRQRVMRFRTAPVVSGVEQQIRWDLESISSLAATPLPSEFTESFIIKCSLLAFFHRSNLSLSDIRDTLSFNRVSQQRFVSSLHLKQVKTRCDVNQVRINLRSFAILLCIVLYLIATKREQTRDIPYG